jgi:two-component system cell cycle sensor histidine kinase/response regulator CckA
VLDELEEVHQASERASAIAEQLQAFSGGTALQTRPASLNDIVEGVLPRLRQLFGRDIEIVPDLSLDMKPVMADPAQMQHVILKLAANSRDAMARHGIFRLQTANQPAMDPGLGSIEAAGGPYGMLAISDNGPGLDDESWAHLYEPFFSTKAEGHGLGLGLAAVYGIVRQSSGRLWAYSQPGNGTTFRIYLPLVESQSPALPAPPMDRGRSRASILLVEAHDGMRTVMANVLKKRGYRVLAALDSKEAMRITKAQGPPDLLISRPEPELAMRLARLQPHLRVLHLGGYADSPDAQDQGLPPRTAILRKPFEPEALLATVLELLSQPL